jgi:hypothetical protein
MGSLSTFKSTSAPTANTEVHHLETNHIVKWTRTEFTVRIPTMVVLGGLVVSVLATGPKVRGFNPGRGRWIFKGDKNP